MQIEVKGRNTKVPEELEERLARRFDVIGKQVSELAELTVELRESADPKADGEFVASAELRLKGTTLRATGAGHDAVQAAKRASDELEVQVKRQREKRRRRREAHAAAAELKLDAQTAPEPAG